MHLPFVMLLVTVLLAFVLQMTEANPADPIPCYPGQERDSNGKCQDCKDGFFSTHGKHCQQCTKCHMGQHQKHVCELSRDTLCVCDDGKYLKDGICKDCTDCPAGMYQKRECGHNLNRVCEPCPQGYHTNHTNTKKCLPNAHTTASTSIIIHHNYPDKKLTISLVALVCFLLFLFAAVLYFLGRRKRRRRNRVITNNNPGFEEATPLNFDFSQETDSNHVHMEDVPYHVYESLALKLNPEEMNNWRNLGSYLKVSNEKIKNLALLPNLATQKLLDEWMTQPNATAYNLYMVLSAMGRLDAADLLEPYLYKSKDLNSTV